MKAPGKMVPFGYKLLISYWVFMLLPVAAVGYFSYTSSVHSIQQQAQNNIAGTLQQIRDNIQYKTTIIAKISDQIFFDEGMQVLLTKPFQDYESYQQTSQYLLPKLSSTLYLAENRDASIRIYLRNKTIPEVYFEQSESNPLSRGRYFEIYHLARIERTKWYQSLELDDMQIKWAQVDSDQAYGNLSLVRRLVDFISQQQQGSIRIIGKLDDIFEAVDYKKISEQSHVLVMDEREHLVLQSGKLPFSLDWKEQAKGNLTIRENIPGLNWQLVALVPISSLENNAKQVKWITMLICLVSFIVLALIGLVVAKYFSKRVNKIVHTLQSFQSGDFQKRITYSGNDEFFLIAGAFNEMAQKVQELIDKVYVVNLEKKEAELRVLQAQINPHFLYNTLSSISRLAKLGEVDKLHDMVVGLAKFYRLTLNHGKSVISVYDEIQQVQAYIDIQKIKFMDRMDVQYDIDPSVFPFDTVKIILQPFIENILEHALYADRIHIRLIGYLEQSVIVMRVIDDGIGMNEDTIKRIMDDSAEPLGYGIRNVDNRIKMHFGKEYGVTIFSRLGIGTTIQIVFPATRTKNSGGTMRMEIP